MNINESPQAQLEALLRVPEGAHQSPLDALRTGPVLISGPSLVRSLSRLQSVRHLGIAIPATVLVPTSRIATLARFADKAKVSAVLRLPEASSGPSETRPTMVLNPVFCSIAPQTPLSRKT